MVCLSFIYALHGTFFYPCYLACVMTDFQISELFRNIYNGLFLKFSKSAEVYYWFLNSASYTEVGKL